MKAAAVAGAIAAAGLLLLGCGGSGPNQHEKEVAAVMRDFKLVDEARAESRQERATASEAIRLAEDAMGKHEQQGFNVLMVSARRAIGRAKDQAARIRHLLADVNRYSRPAIREATEQWTRDGHAGGL